MAINFKNNIIIQFEVTSSGPRFFCHATCDGITIGNWNGENRDEAAIGCFTNLMRENKIEHGSLCIFVDRMSRTSFRDYYSEKKPFAIGDLFWR